ncbi:50S ribosomal protein L25/general stress protein Ctc [Neiella marina]|uniref:Large ribosomal subunit protein bL25 n=1 Tax=Neiella holothuriorum TaxID=2870530 RepID=A0ABS7EL43_9GAMM|nr:50S ribosomal protein L25/general stress protein Ctc [Neiella holothuriorum]MBW8192935.1 50S ribosomal protein L25/general stress protein Ctc [Neiella holothuriorum]
MSDQITLDAAVRNDLGKGASRRLRHADKVPAILYGAGQEPQALTLEHSKVLKIQESESFYSSVINLNIDGTSVQAILKDMQRHPFKPKVTHLDFLRVDATQALVTTVPVHFLNEDTAEAVKNGGVVNHLANEIAVSCLPADLPEYIEVDLANVEIGQTIHLSEIKLPEGVESVELAKGESHDLAVVGITAGKGGSDEEEAEGEAAEGDAE